MSQNASRIIFCSPAHQCQLLSIKTLILSAGDEFTNKRILGDELAVVVNARAVLSSEEFVCRVCFELEIIVVACESRVFRVYRKTLARDTDSLRSRLDGNKAG